MDRSLTLLQAESTCADRPGPSSEALSLQRNSEMRNGMRGDDIEMISLSRFPRPRFLHSFVSRRR